MGAIQSFLNLRVRDICLYRPFGNSDICAEAGRKADGRTIKTVGTHQVNRTSARASAENTWPGNQAKVENTNTGKRQKYKRYKSRICKPSGEHGRAIAENTCRGKR